MIRQRDWRHKLARLNAWWQLPAGASLLQSELQFLGHYIYEQFGYRLLILADAYYADLVNMSRMQQCQRLDPTHLLATDLPGAIDAIVIPHWLAYHPDAEAWLQRLWQVLDANGKLIITGYSYQSYLGLQRLMWHSVTRGLPSWLHSRTRLKKMLRAHDFQLLLDHKFAARWLCMGHFVENTLPMPSLLGDIYCLVASKQLVTVKTFHPRWGSITTETKTSLASHYERKQTK